MGKGYMGKILWVDLATGKINEETIPDETYKKFLTGYGIGAKIIYDRVPPGADALGPDNILGLCSGVLTGTGALFSGRFMAVGKSPLTGGWGDANCGGYFSPALKRAGYDAVFFTGISPKPIYLFIDNGKAEIRDAAHLWGKDIVDTEKAITEELQGKKVQIASIGPAGEKLSLIAGIANDGGRYAARSGLGAVMGSKKIKAVVVTGKAKIEAEQPERMKSLSKDFGSALNKTDFLQKILGARVVKALSYVTRVNPIASAQPAPIWGQILKKYGTGGVTAMSAEVGDSPVKNWGGAGCKDFPLSKSSKIGDDAMIKYQDKHYGCFSCPVKCGGIMKVTDGQWPLEESHKPEYETLCAFGTLCLVDDIHAILKLNDMCNRGGLDSISAGGVVAFTIECVETGILTKEDVGGLELGWGKPEPMIKLLEMIIKREGIGDVLADGVKRAAEKIGKGSERFAIHAGGQELPMHDGKNDGAQGLSYEVEPTPGRHTIVSFTWQELMNMKRYDPNADPVKPMEAKSKKIKPEGKAKNNAINSRLMQVVNSAGVCMFGLTCGPRYPLFEYLNAATGWALSAEDYMLTGERIETLRHAFNLREGIRFKDTRMSDRARGVPPLTEGPHTNSSPDFETMARDFYKEMGWDFETGNPDKARLEKLGLDEVIKDIYG